MEIEHFTFGGQNPGQQLTKIELFLIEVHQFNTKSGQNILLLKMDCCNRTNNITMMLG